MRTLRNCLAVVMAAGEAKRFGQRKIYQPLNDKPLIHYVLDALARVDLGRVIVVAQPGDELDTPFEVLENPDFPQGQSTSIRVAMNTAGDWDGVFFCPADQPFLDETIFLKMAELLEPGLIVVPRFQGRNGSPTLFSRTFRQELLELTGEEGGRPIIRRHPEAVRYIEVDHEQMFFDIDTPEDLARAEQWVREQSREFRKNCDRVKP